VTETVVTTGGGGGAAVTVIVAVPDFPAVAAVIVAEPAATPVTTPLEFTVATFASLVDQLMDCPAITLPFWSFTTAVRLAVPPTPTVADGGETVTDVTTGGGGSDPLVEAATMFESPPNTALAFRVPRNATTWKS
jgi:hypothetical protein